MPDIVSDIQKLMSGSGFRDIPNRESNTAWDQQKTESAKDYRLFVDYLLLGEKRTLKEVAKIKQFRETGEVPENLTATSKISKLSKKYQWKKRAEAFDSATLKEAVQSYKELSKKLHEMRLGSIAALTRVLTGAVSKIRLPENYYLTPKDLKRFVDAILVLQEAHKNELDPNFLRESAGIDINSIGEEENVWLEELGKALQNDPESIEAYNHLLSISAGMSDD